MTPSFTSSNGQVLLSGSVLSDPGRGSFVRELMERRAQPADRYELHAWTDGYVIRDRGEVICRFHGPQSGLASKVLRLLVEAERA